MSKKYIGKICPYCKTPFAEGETVVFCSICDMPHHLSCWQDNQGCTTFGCTGSIKEIIGGDINTTVASPAQQPTQPEVAVPPVSPRPIKTIQTEKPIEILYQSKELAFMSDVPLVLENTALIIDRTQDKLFARCTFRSITHKAIKAILIELSCLDVWGNTLGDPIPFQYLDLKTKREAKFGQTNPIELVDKNTREFTVSVKKVLFEDNSVVDGGGISARMPAPTLLSQYLKSNELAAEYVRETTPKAQYVPVHTDSYWQCTCGSLNFAADEKCHLCGCSREHQFTALNTETLTTNMLKIREAKRIAEEKAKAEQAERIRLAEEQVRLEREKKEQERLAAEQAKKEKRKRIKKKIVRVISLILVLLLGYGVIFWGIPYIRYQVACKAFENAEYDSAYQTFVKLDDFMDSSQLAKEALYQKGQVAFENKQYDTAIEIFEELGYYKNSRSLLRQTEKAKENEEKEARYQEGITALSKKDYDTAIGIFTELGSYADSKDKLAEAKRQKENAVKEARYQEGITALNNKQYNTAITIFTELGSYAESKTKLAEARNQKEEAAKKVRYQEGITALSKKDYDTAIGIFAALGDYSDSKAKLTEAENGKKEIRYQEGIAALNSEQYDKAISIFAELGNYSDSKTKLAEAENGKKEIRYQEGLTALNNNRYDDAIVIFSELGNYSDSKAKLIQAQNKRIEILYQDGIIALNNKEYSAAITYFTEAGSYSDSKSKLTEAKYEQSLVFLNNKKYEDAYKLLKDVGNYKDAQSKLTSCLYSWADVVLSSSKKADAERFKSAVSLSSEHYSAIYTKIWDKINSHNDFDYWDDYWNDTPNAAVVYAMLKTLPSSYQETATLCKLFEDLCDGDFHPVAEYIRSNKTFIESVWHIDFIKDFVAGDDMIYTFLEATWRSSDSNYYFTFYENDEGGTSCQYNLPAPTKPYGTKYYCFENLNFYWDDDNNHLARAFTFTIVDFNTINVLSYKDSKIYTLYRSY